MIRTFVADSICYSCYDDIFKKTFAAIPQAQFEVEVGCWTPNEELIMVPFRLGKDWGYFPCDEAIDIYLIVETQEELDQFYALNLVPSQWKPEL